MISDYIITENKKLDHRLVNINTGIYGLFSVFHDIKKEFLIKI